MSKHVCDCQQFPTPQESRLPESVIAVEKALRAALQRRGGIGYDDGEVLFDDKSVIEAARGMTDSDWHRLSFHLHSRGWGVSWHTRDDRCTGIKLWSAE